MKNKKTLSGCAAARPKKSVHAQADLVGLDAWTPVSGAARRWAAKILFTSAT
jgi:hypothetical protein